ncbi:MAG: hypothetical protein MJZ57_10045 [Bacteroidales bacterium]|nr:hypothetical protein [Bacteroidales bacterium]
MKPLFLVLLFSVLSCVSFAQVQQDCGALDCPGRCGRFVDQNGDGFCDHGRVSAPAVAEPAPAATTPAETHPTKPETAKTAVPGKAADRQSSAKTTEPKTEEVVPATTEPADTTTVEPLVAEPTQPAKTKSPYSLILISSITFGLYIITSILVKTDKLKKATHRKIWNVLLLITGLVSCLLGFFLVIQINYNLKMDWLWTVKLYHVQFGIAMTIIAVIHILWHVNYWKTLVNRKK